MKICDELVFLALFTRVTSCDFCGVYTSNISVLSWNIGSDGWKYDHPAELLLLCYAFPGIMESIPNYVES